MNTTDLLKTEEAKALLPIESRNAIDSIDWKGVIIGMRKERGYSFTQLDTLETETELLLCGLTTPENYPRELETKMGIPKDQVGDLVNEMNDRVFKKIREELIKNIEKKKSLGNNIKNTNQNELLENREKLLEEIENADLSVQKELKAPTKEELEEEIKKQPTIVKKVETPSILSQKLSGTFQIPKTETEHTILNITKDANTPNTPKTNLPKVDPYREIPS